jgi:hypothetical protein
MPWTPLATQVNLSNMSITLGEFLKSLGKSISGMVLGSGREPAHIVGKAVLLTNYRQPPLNRPVFRMGREQPNRAFP